MKKNCLLVFILILSLQPLKAQDLTHQGTDFWIAFTEVYDMKSSKFEVNISSAVSTNGVLSIYAGKFRVPFKVVPGKVTTVSIPRELAQENNSELVVNKAIHVESKHPVTVQAVVDRKFSSEYALCLPSSSFGSEYMVSSFRNYEEHYTGFHYSEFVVVCGSYPVQVEIVPSCATLGGRAANTPFTVDLNPGDLYLVKAYTNNFGDLTGSTVRATDDTSRFIVYQGHGFTKIATKKCEEGTSGDPLYDIALPTHVWGNNFILMRPNVQYMNWFRVVSLEDSCAIYRGTTFLKTIDAGEFYDGQITDQCVMIRTTKPASVSQFFVSAAGVCNPQKIGDPSMATICSNEQMYLQNTTFSVSDQYSKNYLTIAVRSADANLINLNNKTLKVFITVPEYPDFSYLVMQVDSGAHTVSTSGKGFQAYICGVQEAETSFSPAGIYVGKKIEIFERNFPFFSFYFLNDEHEQFIDRMDSLYYKNTKEIAELMYFNDDLSMHISGFTSTPGDSLYNSQLSWDRAQVVKIKIIEQYKRLCLQDKRPALFNEARLVVNAYGEDPLYLKEPNDNDEENEDELLREKKQAKNRRVEVVFVLE